MTTAAITPISVAHCGDTNPAAGELTTSPATHPIQAPVNVHVRFLKTSIINQVIIHVLAVRFVETIAVDAVALAE